MVVKKLPFLFKIKKQYMKATEMKKEGFHWIKEMKVNVKQSILTLPVGESMSMDMKDFPMDYTSLRATVNKLNSQEDGKYLYKLTFFDNYTRFTLERQK